MSSPAPFEHPPAPSQTAPSPSALSHPAPIFLDQVRLPHTGQTVHARLVGGRVQLGRQLKPQPGDRLLRAEGRWLIPGLWDAHVHFDQWAQTRGRLDLTAVASSEEAVTQVVRALEERQAPRSTHGRGSDSAPTVLFGQGYRSSAWEHQPTVAQLDAVTGNQPVVLISGDMHNGWLNTAAIELIGARETAPDGSLRIPQGALTENDWFPLFGQLERHMPVTETLISEALEQAACRGVVGLVDLEFAPNHRTWSARAAASGQPLPVRISAGFYQDHLEEVIAAGLRTGDVLDGHGMVRMGPLKIISDGSLGTRTAHCCEPYLASEDLAERYGVQNETPQRLRELLERAVGNGLEVALHAIGDAAVSHALDAFAATGAGGSIEHAQLMRPGDIPRMAALGLTASVQPDHLLDDRDVSDLLWADRTERCFPFQDLQGAGVRLALGSDAPVSPLDPWAAMAAAVYRSALPRRAGADAQASEDGGQDDVVRSPVRPPWHQEQAITAAAALTASTRGITGVQEGMAADLVVVEENPLAVADPLTAGRVLRSMQVAATFVGGRPTYQRLSEE